MQDVRRLAILGIALLAVALYVIVTTGSPLTRAVMVGAAVLYAVGVFQIRRQTRHRRHPQL
jgi:Flp pilus assembly protein TadB